MTRGTKSAVGILLVVASLAAPIAVRFRAAARLRREKSLWTARQAQLTRVRSENKRLSDLANQPSNRPLSNKQLLELLKLRGEAATLKKQTNALPTLRMENERWDAESKSLLHPTTPLSEAELNEVIELETLSAMKTVLLHLPSAMQKFAAAHGGHGATDFYQLRPFFPDVNGRRMPGLYTFQFVRDDGPRPGDALVLRESGARHTAEGTCKRVYGFRNGTAMEVTVPEHRSDNFFEAWEKQHMASEAAIH